jgi:hypothetical protein
MARPNTEPKLRGLEANVLRQPSVEYVLRLSYRNAAEKDGRRSVPIPFHRLSRLVVIGAPCFARVRGTTRYACRVVECLFLYLLPVG